MIKFMLSLLFVMYFLWQGWDLWKEKEKRDLWVVSGFALLTVYFMLASYWQWPTVNFLLIAEDYTGPISRWFQQLFGAVLPQ